MGTARNKKLASSVERESKIDDVLSDQEVLDLSNRTVTCAKSTVNLDEHKPYTVPTSPNHNLGFQIGVDKGTFFS